MMDKFDDLRPYYVSEIPSAMQRIAESPYLPEMAKFVFPDKEIDEVRNLLQNIQTVDDFQFQVMYYFNQSVINRSIKEFTYNGVEYLDPQQNYLFVSNHRDIVLDSALMQYLFYLNGLRTTEITFGSNLMSSQLAIDIGRSNKMFKVVRGGNIRDFYKNSLHLSEYIRHTITEKKESIWIAQRNGRTKDGNDATDQGIIKMFCMSGTKDMVASLNDLHIVPVAVSYEIEPCDILKTRELYLSHDGREYVKKEGEDFHSILTGITQYKGNVHFSICEPVKHDELSRIAEEYPNEFHKKVALLIDQRIYMNYKLQRNNYIAHDIRSGKDTYKMYYTAEEKDTFLERRKRMLKEIGGDESILDAIFLGIYANPVNKSE